MKLWTEWLNEAEFNTSGFSNPMNNWDDLFPLVMNTISLMQPEDFRDRSGLASQLEDLRKTIEIKLGEKGGQK